MIERADVVVIGSGGLGAATAFYLMTRGAGHVALLDRHEIGSQTSPRAAGMAAHARSSDLMAGLMTSASARLRRFTQDTGEPLSWTQCGSLKVARRPADAHVLEAELDRAMRLGLDARLISPEAAHRLNPFLEPAGVLAVLWVGEDLYFDPAQVAVGFARGAGARGATILPHTTVTGVEIVDGSVTGVETDRGPIRTPVVVDAAGAWTRQVAAMSGIRVPIVPTRHQLFVTEPLPGVRADLPMVRIMDAGVYVRSCEGGLLWGVFEEDPRRFDMDELDGHFQIADLSLDPDVLWRAAADVALQLPALGAARVREHRGGLPTMTADGHHIVGPAPAAEGFFIAGGCNVAGLSISPAIGDAIAAWITEGGPPIDLAPLSLERFRSDTTSEEQLREQALWQYRHFYGSV
ncbi:MAG TPA: FAD-binding oxidoreductase [Solirubrobacteraceae bacterium]|nr:FAD-binding oxidoreductase [Solirubrobacteraceae bacterium]